MAKVVDGKKRGRPGRWLVDFYDQNGKRRWETYPTKERALARQGELEDQVERKTYLAPNARPTVTKCAEAWLANRQDRHPATVGGWETHVYRHIVPRIGDVRIDLVDPADVERFRDALAAGSPVACEQERKTVLRKLSAKTVNKVLTTLTSIFDQAMRDHRHLVKQNPAELAQRLRPASSGELAENSDARDDDPLAIDPSDVPTPEEAGRLIEHAPPGLFRSYLLTAALTGARSEELLALQWRHVDLDGKIMPSNVDGPKIRIRRAVSWARTRKDADRPNGPRFFRPKTAASRRDVPIPPRLVDALRAWRRDCPTPVPLGLVFPKVDGAVMHRKLLYDQGLLPALKAASLRHFTIHSLRHCFASSLAAHGRPATEIASYLGHGSSDVTLRVYTHWFPKQRTGAMESHASRVLGEVATGVGSTSR
ncbi:MAG: site-specific integrase [Candidatus Binatia bacterium]